MLTVNKLVAQGRGLAPALLRRAATVELGWDTRSKSRFDAVDNTGRTLACFLPRGGVVRGGDVLVAEDGSLVVVRAAAQPVLEVRAGHVTPEGLLRAAYHLGNRHVPVELRADHLKIEPDHVLAALLRRMRLEVTETQAAFEPEGGAYQSGGHAAHGPHAQDVGAQDPHGHDHDHEHHDHGHHGHDHTGREHPGHEHPGHEPRDH